MNKKFVTIVAILSVVIIGLVIGLSLALIYPLPSKKVNDTMADNSLIVNEKESNGICLAMSPVSAVSQAEMAYNITATVSPSDAVNQKLNWAMEWSNPTSTWANGKSVNDYITMTIDESTKVATVSCKGPFGTQVIVKASAQENASISATCTLDYSQKVTSASLNIGNVAVNFGGDTNIKYEIAKGVKGMGGIVAANVSTSEVYSLVETYTKSVKLSYVTIDGVSKHFALKGNTITGASKDYEKEYLGQEIYFDYDHDINKWFIMQRDGDIMFDEMTTAEIASYFGSITQPIMYDITLTLKGKYNTYTYTSRITCNGFTNNTKVSGVSVANGGYVF